MNEVYAKIRILEQAIEELRKTQVIIANSTPRATGEKLAELTESRNKISEAIASLSEKRLSLILENACSIAGISPISF